MEQSGRLITAEEFLLMPDSGGRDELVRGVVQHRPYLYTYEGFITANLLTALGRYIIPQSLGEALSGCGFILTRDPDTVRAANVAFIRRERLPAEHLIGYWPGPPDMAALLLSDTDEPGDLPARLDDWLTAGTPLLILVDPRKHQLTIYRRATQVETLTEKDTLDGGDVLPGWRVPVRQIFE